MREEYKMKLIELLKELNKLEDCMVSHSSLGTSVLMHNKKEFDEIARGQNVVYAIEEHEDGKFWKTETFVINGIQFKSMVRWEG
jgi:alpha-L-arabinofuranosidase